MPRTVGDIPLGIPIVTLDGKSPGEITLFMRQWVDQLINGAAGASLIVDPVSATGQNAAIPTTNAYAAALGGLYRVSYYVRKTTPDGFSSNLAFTYGWTEGGLPLTESIAAGGLATDSTSAEQSGTKVMRIDDASALTFAIAYASNTPGLMHFRYDVTVEKLS